MIAGRNISNLRYADATIFMAEKRGTNEPLDEIERREWKSWLKTQHLKKKEHGIQSHYFMANIWGNNGISETVFLGSKVTADSDCSHEI